MNEIVKARCELFLENRELINKCALFDNNHICIAAALVLTNSNLKIDVDKIKACKAILKKKANVFSGFRGYIETILLCKMSMSSDPEKYCDDVIRITKMIQKNRIFEYYGDILAAMSICDLGKEDAAQELTDKCKTIMKRMSAEHPVLTDSNDTPFAMLLAFSEKDIDSIISEVEECFSYMKQNFRIGGNANQGISEVLALYNAPVQEKCDRVIDIYNKLKDRGQKFGKEYEFSALGVLSNLKVDIDELTDEISEAAELLHKDASFGNFFLGPESRRMFASLLVANVYGEDSDKLVNTVVSNSVSSIIATIIAEEIALMTIIIISAN